MKAFLFRNVVGWLSSAALLAAAPAWANFSPIAVVTADRPDAFEGQSIGFSSAGSIDPDQAPSALTFAWDFGDGTQATGPSPQHAYASAGAYPVTLTVSDGQDTALAILKMVVLPPVSSQTPRATSPLVLTQDSRWLWVVNTDSSSVSLVDTSSLELVREISVGARPRTLALSNDEATLWVVCEEGGGLWEIDVARRETRASHPVGHMPYGVLVLPGSGELLVSSQGTGTVEVLDASSGARLASIVVGETPRAMALSPTFGTAYVTHFLTRGSVGQVTRIDLASRIVQGVSSLAHDPGPDTSSSGRGFPNLLGAAAIDRAEQTLWVGGIKSNTSTGLFLSGSAAQAVNLVRGLAAPVDLATGQERLSRRIDTDNADGASAMAFSPSGRFLYVTHQGLGALSVYDAGALVSFSSPDGSSIPFESRVTVGDAPQGIVLNSVGTRGYVLNFLSRSISVLDLTVASHPVVVGEVVLTSEPLPPNIINGKRMFYRSAGPRHSFEGYIACTSCHPDGGGHDGRTWDFTSRGEGLRNTRDLRGVAGLGHGPVHWSANFDEIQDFILDIVNHAGGKGLLPEGELPHPSLGEPNGGRSQDLDDLAAYVTSLRSTPRSPYRGPDGSLTDAGRRGEALFETLACKTCHPAPTFTDSSLETFILHDVGTQTAGSGQRLGGPLPGFDTPTLLGVWQSAPYFHDGSAPTLAEVFSTSRTGPHALALDAGSLQDLIAYLNALEGTAPDPDPGSGAPSGCGCNVHSGGHAELLLLCFVLVLLVRRKAFA